MRYCSGCSQTFTLDFFHKKGKAGFHSRCKKCVNAYNAEWHNRGSNRKQRTERVKNKYNPEVRRRYLLKKNYGLSLQDFDNMLKTQNYLCAICLDDKPGGVGTWKIDHDHATGKVRGLLCNSCNTMLGHAKDSLDIIYSASLYLLKDKEVLF